MNTEEGVLKYQSTWENADCLAANDTQTLNRYRHVLWQKKLIGSAENIGYGNISVRSAENPQHFIISGTQTGHLAHLKPQQFSKVIYTKIKNNILFCQGKVQASSEALTHAGIYKENIDIQCVIHIHNNIFWQKNLNKLHTSDQNASYGTPEITQSVRFLFINKIGKTIPNIIIMGGHYGGILCFGQNLHSTTEYLIKNIDNT